MPFELGDVVLVPFPFTSHVTSDLISLATIDSENISQSVT
jgi:hypothetical protein